MGISLSPHAKLVLQKRYLRRDPGGKTIETPEALLDRVATCVAAVETRFDPAADIAGTRDRFYRLMASLRFLPNSPTLMNAGRPLGQLAACFVLPIEDDTDSIFETLKHTAQIHKSGGGTGFSFSRLRPANDVVSSSAGVSSGPVAFMAVFDVVTETVKQGGTRRGANMAVLRVDHPDIEAFITAKTDFDRLTNFNLSVAMTDSFMQALAQGGEHRLINPRNGQVTNSLPAQQIFDRIVDCAWRSGEPGVIFIDRINRDNPTPQLGAIEATNPCGEQPLLPYESCTLGSINLSAMVVKNEISWGRLKQTVRTAVHFLDNVVEVNRYPLAVIEKMSLGNRKIGLGVMGFADMLIKHNIPYDSEEALAQAERLMAFITAEARQASAELARRRGNFPNYPGSRFDTPETPLMRNATVTTIAPTGSLSIIAGTSSGIEPLFAVAHDRRVLDGETLHEVHPLLAQAARKQNFHSAELIAEIARSGSLQGISGVPDEVKKVFRTAQDIAPEWHVRLQAAFQKHTDNAVSKTVNVPATASRAEIAQVFLAAYRSGCKGVTVYRYGSRGRQVLNIGQPDGERPAIAPRPRPERTRGVTERITTGCGKLYVTVNTDGQGLCEVFAKMGKTGGCASSQIEAAGRLISLALRSGIKVESVVRQLSGIRCPAPAWQNGQMVLSCPDAIAQVLGNVTGAEIPAEGSMMGACPDCGAALTHQEGCLMCPACGFSKCG
ncbi:MAG: vitamin B12-dependent ribonucleotide reductase [Desulfobacteraceae bacterium]|nr:vitamin B12-dependent ribonucleotide reductase [Desulfobacteraceae bacterium]